MLFEFKYSFFNSNNVIRIKQSRARWQYCVRALRNASPSTPRPHRPLDAQGDFGERARLLFKGPRSPGPAVSKRELSHYVATPKRFVGCIASVDPRCCALLSKAAATEGEVHVA